MNFKYRRKITLAMAIMLISSQPVLANSLVEKKKEAENQKNQIQSKLNQTESKIDSTKGQVGSVQAEINALDAKISSASYELEQVTNDISLLKVEIEKTRAELEEAKAKLEENKELFAKRLRVMYMANDTGYLDVILSSSNVEDLIGNTKIISSIAEQDRDLVQEMKEQVQIIEEKQLELERQEASLKQKQAIVAEKKASLESANAQKISYMNGLLDNLQAYESEYNSMLSESSAIEAKILQLQSNIEEEARQEALARQREEAQKISSQKAPIKTVERKTYKNTTTVRRSTYKSASNVVDASAEPIRREASGSMYWPVPGHSRVSSPYGYRIHPILKTRKLHTGIDVPAPSGTPAVSAKDGVVIASSFMRGYGNCIMVDNGDMVTVYAHLSSRAVSVGSSVSAGQTIGYVGSTGMSTGPHLHFEVRINGRTTNPMNYL